MMDGSPAPSQTPGTFVRRAGIVCVAAGLLGAASGVVLAMIGAQVPDSRYSYPLTATAFVAVQLWFAVQHLGLLVGLFGLRLAAVAGAGRPAVWGPIIGIAGMVLLTLTELVAIGAADDPYPSSLTNVLDGLYAVASLGVGVGLTVVGIAVLRTRQWTGWRRWVPLTLGVWVFVPMTPAIVAGYVPARLAIAAWMLGFAALGLALATRAPGRNPANAGRGLGACVGTSAHR